MKIGIDIDDVLAETLPAFIGYNNRHHGGAWSLDHFHSARWEEVLGVTSDQLSDRLEHFFSTPEFHGVEPSAGAARALRALGRSHELHIVSARWDVIVEPTKRWLDDHFAGLFTGVHFAANHYTSRAAAWAPRLPKDGILAREGIDILIEDSLEYGDRCLAAGYGVILFDRPWNRQAADPRYHRVKAWSEVVSTVTTLAQHNGGERT
jgi:uncharacterized HAD superfamily protein